MDFPTPDWCCLPEHLLAMIAERLPTRMDIQLFGAVCSTFRSSISPPPKPFSPYPDLDLEYYSTDRSYPIRLEIIESTVYAVEPDSEISNVQRSIKTLLLKSEESSSGERRIQNLLRKNIPNLPKTLNLLDYRVKEISKGYRVKLVTNSGCHLFGQSCISSDDERSLLAAIGVDKVFLWKGGNKKGTKIDIGFDDYVDDDVLDIVYHNKKFYILISDGRVVTVDPKSLKVTEAVDYVPPRYCFLVDEYFVRLSNDLFLTHEYWFPGKDLRRNNVHLYIFKLDEEKHEWIPVKGGWADRSLFLWEDCSFVLSTKEYSGFKGNCVYILNKVREEINATPVSIFNLKDGTSTKLSSLPAPSWFFPKDGSTPRSLVARKWRHRDRCSCSRKRKRTN